MEGQERRGIVSRLRSWAHHYNLKLFPYIPFQLEPVWLELLEVYPELTEGQWEAEYCSLQEADIFMVWGPLNPKQWERVRAHCQLLKAGAKVYLFWEQNSLEHPELVFDQVKEDFLFRSFCFERDVFVAEVVKQLENYKNMILMGEVEHA